MIQSCAVFGVNRNLVRIVIAGLEHGRVLLAVDGVPRTLRDPTDPRLVKLLRSAVLGEAVPPTDRTGNGLGRVHYNSKVRQ